jgi:uncharacterized hydrophobic protein (TIGR00341 family)
MAQRFLKIILPPESGHAAMEILEGKSDLDYWQEESSNRNFVIGALMDSSKTEEIMDILETRFTPIEKFKMILFPVEASVPRNAKKETPTDIEQNNSELKGKSKLRISREELYSHVSDDATLSGVYVSMVILSTVVAAVGLLRNNAAVIIGAMVIAPLLGPNVAFALSTNLADLKLGLNSVKTLTTGILIAFFLSAVMGYGLATDTNIHEISLRTQIHLSDIILALSSGCAGILAFTTGMSSAVIGVMVAAALLPPLVVSGLLFGDGQFGLSFSAFLLFSINIICINLAGVATLFFQGITPRSWWEAGKAKKATRNALIIWTIILIILTGILFLWQFES